ncbi:hypothetical protein DN069_32110 [Streptacidiphilus pinicola]|uniref:MASE1 domain-containing protein n=1 Tax=Streptacidiphilus pinicola TaxID=2219663 RepID=A0A2X0K2R8_9ACTN|nr:hypothetical protein [Streptacidiphilus pinicola]RAG81600.1 hypothetical protein DN069_32110 [Streptacidiphilus pinicola]
MEAASRPPRRPARTAIGRSRGRHRTLLVATCAALVAAAIADEATGYDGPGPFIYPAFALVVALAPGRYTPLLAAAMSAFFTVGGLASRAFVHGLVTPSQVLEFTAGWAQMLSFAAAAVLATAAVVRAPRVLRPDHPS